MARPKRKVNPVLPVATPVEQPRRIYRTGGYVRLSVEDSGKPGADTIEAQKALVLEYIEEQPDMQFCGLFCDNGRTGTNFDRPQFERLMSDVRTGKIDCIVVKDLSRFGRNYKETGNYLERIFPFLDVRFVAVNDHFDTATAERSSDGYIIPLKNIMKNKCRLGRVAECLEPHDAQGEICMFLSYSFSAYVERGLQQGYIQKNTPRVGD